MKTHQSLTNAYIRGLLAREMIGYRISWKRSADAGYPIDESEKAAILGAVERSFSRFQVHLDRHCEELVAGNPEPLRHYGRGFAGH